MSAVYVTTVRTVVMTYAAEMSARRSAGNSIPAVVCSPQRDSSGDCGATAAFEKTTTINMEQGPMEAVERQSRSRLLRRFQKRMIETASSVERKASDGDEGGTTKEDEEEEAEKKEKEE